MICDILVICVVRLIRPPRIWTLLGLCGAFPLLSNAAIGPKVLFSFHISASESIKIKIAIGGERERERKQ
jgi:hypothetical protein